MAQSDDVLLHPVECGALNLVRAEVRYGNKNVWDKKVGSCATLVLLYGLSEVLLRKS